MVLNFSKRNLLKHSKLGSIIILLLIIVLFVLPKLLNLFWEFDHRGPRLDKEHLLEQPLRVECCSWPI